VLDWKSGKAIHPEAFLQSILSLLLRRRLNRRIGPSGLLAGLRRVPQANEARSSLPARRPECELRLHAFPEQGG
jgi:hypothetical protein